MASQKKHKRRAIQSSDPGKILDLVMSLNDDSCAQLQIKINTYLTEETEAELVLQIIVNRERMEASIEAVGETALPRKMKICMFNRMNETLRGSVEQSEYLTNFPADIMDIITPYLGKKEHIKTRVVMFPIVEQPFSVVVCAVGPTMQHEDVAVYIQECFLFVWPTLKKAIAFEYECSLKHKCQQLLRVARRLFTQVASLDTLLQIATEQVKQLTKAEHCKVMLIDLDKMQLVDSSKAKGEKEAVERRFPLNVGIAGHVIQTGALVNAKVLKDCAAYDTTIDGYPGVDAKTILCFPIREQTGIIGVGQLVNKLGDPYFDSTDEEMALAVSIYCGVCITHSVVYQRVQEAHVRSALANELVMYHMKVTDAEVSRVRECTGFHAHPHLASLHFNPRALPLRELPCYVIKMFNDLGFDRK